MLYTNKIELNVIKEQYVSNCQQLKICAIGTVETDVWH